MSTDREASFATWWNHEGSAMRPLATEDTEEFAKRITAIAFSNGSFVEREASAKLCDAQVERWTKSAEFESISGSVSDMARAGIAKYLGSVIRARGQA